MRRGGIGRRLAVGIALALTLFVAGSIGFGLTVGNGSAPAGRRPSALAGSVDLVRSGMDVTEQIASLEARVTRMPEDWQSWAVLGGAYVQQARISADPTLYNRAERALLRSMEIRDTDNVPALIGLSTLAAARHDFATALEWGERARRLRPHDPVASLVVGDALIELGRYEEGFAAVQSAVDRRPDLSSYSRASYALELQGERDRAAASLELALEAAATKSDAAWVSFQIGELHFDSGRLAEAAESYRLAQRYDPSFVPAGLGLADVAAAEGGLDEAIAAYRDVVERHPLPEYVVALGDLHTAAGETTEAARQYELFRVQQQLAETTGVNMDLEVALFGADHGIELERALDAARAEWERRRSIVAADALAWALYANGRYEEALPLAHEALRLGTPDALFLFHRAMIHTALGDVDASRADLSRAVAINPHFSVLWSGRAAELLAEW